MSTTTTSGTLFKPELVTEMFNKVKGHSSLAKLCGISPIPFAGTDTFVFTMDGEASIVGEGKNKPAGEADFAPVTIKPIKFIYQHRVTDEFVHLAEEKQLPYLKAFSEGFAKKMSRALDIAAFHGVNPYDGEASDTVGNNCFDKAVENVITYDSAKPDDNIDDAVALIQGADGAVTGIAMSPTFGSALGKMKTADSHTAMYPEFRFGANPSTFGGMASDVNNTMEFGSSNDRAIVGDFANAFKWGYAENVPLEIIQFGDPDGLGDLKRTNQIVLRAEAYIGWGILDKTTFARITTDGAAAASEQGTE
ncbi:MAG: phage major capsid protein [Oscillospiraceae bacterium]|nr:phage major capsid protein [Oscillospiraceae bacterium]MBQ8378489.1 phage major capsid protein [Oscillospiraceae bacterium]MBQ8884478.1 phage major capsid protein [Oscillospiraceae bacterium]